MEDMGGYDLEGTICEEVKVLARSLASRMSWSLGTQLGESDPMGAERQAKVIASEMLSLMGCYGFQAGNREGDTDAA